MLQTKSVLIWSLISIVTSEKNFDYNVHGICEPAWQSIYDLFQSHFVSDRDLGASIAIYHQSRLVVGLTGGWYDASKTKPYDDQTLQL